MLPAGAHQEQARALDDNQVRALLRRLFEEIKESSVDRSRRAEARQALAEVVERVELDPLTMAARLHYAVQTGDNRGVHTTSRSNPGSVGI